MKQEIIDRAKWLYAFNGGAISKQQCILQAIQQYGMAKLVKEIQVFDITLNDFVKYLEKYI